MVGLTSAILCVKNVFTIVIKKVFTFNLYKVIIILK